MTEQELTTPTENFPIHFHPEQKTLGAWLSVPEMAILVVLGVVWRNPEQVEEACKEVVNTGLLTEAELNRVRKIVEVQQSEELGPDMKGLVQTVDATYEIYHDPDMKTWSCTAKTNDGDIAMGAGGTMQEAMQACYDSALELEEF